MGYGWWIPTPYFLFTMNYEGIVWVWGHKCIYANQQQNHTIIISLVIAIKWDDNNGAIGKPHSKESTQKTCTYTGQSSFQYKQWPQTWQINNVYTLQAHNSKQKYWQCSPFKLHRNSQASLPKVFLKWYFALRLTGLFSQMLSHIMYRHYTRLKVVSLYVIPLERCI